MSRLMEPGLIQPQSAPVPSSCPAILPDSLVFMHIAPDPTPRYAYWEITPDRWGYLMFDTTASSIPVGHFLIVDEYDVAPYSPNSAYHQGYGLIKDHRAVIRLMIPANTEFNLVFRVSNWADETLVVPTTEVTKVLGASDGPHFTKDYTHYIGDLGSVNASVASSYIDYPSDIGKASIASYQHDDAYNHDLGNEQHSPTDYNPSPPPHWQWGTAYYSHPEFSYSMPSGPLDSGYTFNFPATSIPGGSSDTGTAVWWSAVWPTVVDDNTSSPTYGTNGYVWGTLDPVDFHVTQFYLYAYNTNVLGAGGGCGLDLGRLTNAILSGLIGGSEYDSVQAHPDSDNGLYHIIPSAVQVALDRNTSAPDLTYEQTLLDQTAAPGSLRLYANCEASTDADRTSVADLGVVLSTETATSTPGWLSIPSDLVAAASGYLIYPNTRFVIIRAIPEETVEETGGQYLRWFNQGKWFAKVTMTPPRVVTYDHEPALPLYPLESIAGDFDFLRARFS